MIDIELHGLTARQHTLADILWAYEDGKASDRFIQGLPTAELRNEAKSIKDLMCMAFIEQAYCGLGGTTEADQLIDNIRKR